jgi:hypothetical protein
MHYIPTWALNITATAGANTAAVVGTTESDDDDDDVYLKKITTMSVITKCNPNPTKNADQPKA